MNNWRIWIVASVLWLAVYPAVAAEKVSPDFGKAKPLSVQELNLHRAKYDGKIVRVSGVYAVGTDTHRLENFRLPGRRRSAGNHCISLEYSKLLHPIAEKLLAQSPKKAFEPRRTRLTIVGAFTANTASTDPDMNDMTPMMTGCGAGSLINVLAVER